ncbi:MAG TPA: hypothetical protein VNY75_10700 [Rhizomicrobium sp.]|nr:hypothetical protein [Rhizomicrobium sp.]
MEDYEIRILSDGRTQAVIEAMHLNDHAAIRAAQKYAGGKSFEVWRGLDCIYGAPGNVRPPGLTPAPQP